MNTISVSKLRQNTADVLEKIKQTGQAVTILQRSKPQAVIVDHDYFTALEEAVLDLQDALEAEKAKNEPTVPLEDYSDKRWPKK
jgi:prevent-host-death family protein